MSKRFFVKNEAELIQFGKQLANVLVANSTLLLDGELGAGKTTLTKGIAQGLNINELIKSPTYTFVREYHTGRLPLYHMDVYRLEDIGGEGLGFEEYFESNGVCVVEWSQFIEEQLPNEYLMIHLLRVPNQDTMREVVIETFGKKYEQIMLDIEKTQ